MVLSCFFGSLGLIFVKRLHDIRALELQAWIAVVGGSMLLLLSLSLEGRAVGGDETRPGKAGRRCLHDGDVEPDRAHGVVLPGRADIR